MLDGAKPLAEPLVEPPDPDDPLPDVASTMGHQVYEAAVEEAREHILAGDIFQVVLSQRFEVDHDAHPFKVYRPLPSRSTPAPSCSTSATQRHLVGSSPEVMVRVVDGQVDSRPLAGRAGRGDRRGRPRLAEELLADPKERAEHVMLVDLGRNDVGRVVPLPHRAGRRDDDHRALQPRDAPHVERVGPTGRGR